MGLLKNTRWNDNLIMPTDKHKKSMRLLVSKLSFPFLMAAIGASMIGLSPIFVRFTDIGPNATACYRLFFSLPFLFAWKQAENRANPDIRVKPSPREWAMLAMAGFFFSLDLASWHMAIMRTSIINATIFNNLTPLFVPLLIWVFYAIKPSGLYMTSAIIAITGSAILAGSTFHLGVHSFQGDMFGIFSAMAYSGYFLLVKQLRQRFNAPIIVFWATLASLFFIFWITLAMGENLWLTTLNDWIGVLGLALLVHVLGQSLLAYSMGQLTVAFVSVITLLGPVVAAIMGWIVYGERLSPIQILGGVIVLSSIIAAGADERKSKRKMVEQINVKKS